jgi:hypothetical protein
VEETTTTTTAAAMPPTTTTTRPVTPEARLVGALREQGLMGAFERHGLTEDGLAGLFTDICGDFRRGRDPKSIYFGYRDELASSLPGIEARQIREAYAFAWASGGASFCPEHEDAIMQAPF